MKNNVQAFIAFVLLLGAAVNAFAYSIITGPNGNAATWDDGVIYMSVKLGNSTTLEDGSNFNTSAQAAMTAWNGVLSKVQFSGGDAGSGSAGSGDGVSELAFASDVFGTAFGSNVLAVTVSYRSTGTRSDGTYRRTQSDVVFNNAYTWNSYRGSWRSGTGAAKDLRRVALHELGHVLGLNHPDEASQIVSAIMNSTVGDLYVLQSDDISGAQSLYGTLGSVTAPTITSQPTNLTLASGNSGSLSILASGSTPLAYRWQSAPANSETWTDIPTGGYYYSGALTSTLYIYPDLSYSGTKYRCNVSNSAGSATSNSATLTVTGTAPSVSSNPSNTTITFSNNATFSAYFYGSAPMTYGWQILPAGTTTWADLTDNSVYSGTKSTYLTLTAPPQNYTGNSYRCVANNPLGSANTSAAVLTINPAVAPTISLSPSSTTLDYGSSLSLYASVTGSPSPTMQWKKDGVVISSASSSSSYYKSFVTTADSGSYTLTATNIAGSVTSLAIVVTVREPFAPTITTQPVGVEVSKGNSFSLSVGASGSPNLVYQWYLGGQPINGATSSYYSVSSAALANTGSYTVKITNSVGSVTSNAVDVVVLPSALPVIAGSGGFVSLSSQNTSLYIYPSISGGSSPMTFQWFKDGMPVSAASSSSAYFSKYSATADDAGEYTLVVTNEAGMAVSRPTLVTWQANTATRPWLDSARLGDVVYFLASSPSRIMRYDLARESWLPVSYLPEGKVATGFVPTAAGVFVSYGKQVVRRSLDDQTELPVYSGSGAISGLCAFDSWVIFTEAADTSSTAGTVIVTVDATTLAVVKRDTSHSSTAQALSRGVHPTVSPSGAIATSGINTGDSWTILKINGSGGVDSSSGSFSYSYGNRYGLQRYFSPNEALVFDDSGVIFDATTFAFKGSVGLPFDGAAFREDGTLVLLRGKSVRIYSAGDWRESGEVLLPETASSVFARGSTAFAFGAPATTTSNPVVRKIVTNDFRSLQPPMTVNPAFFRFSVEDAYLDSRGVLNIISRSARAVIRWDPATKSFLSTVPLRETPSLWNYAPSYDRLVFGGPSGAVVDLDFTADSPTGRLQGQFSPYNQLIGIAAADALTVLTIGDSGSSGDSMLTLSATGAVVWRGGSSYNGTGLFWDSSSRRLYIRPSSYETTSLTYSTISTAGVATASNISGTNLTGFVRFSPEDSLILSANGRIVNPEFQQVAVLPNLVVDGAWLSNSLFTIRGAAQGTQVQKWTRVTYQPSGTLTLAGSPLKVFKLSASQLLVLTLDGGYVTMHIINSDLSVASTTSNRPPAIVTNRAPSATLSVSTERGLGQTITIAFEVGDPDGNFAYADLWVNSPRRGWLALRADNSLVASSALSAANAVATAPGTHRRRFTFTPTDGPGAYTFALSAVDAAGARTDATNQYVTVASASRPPQASFTLSGQRAMNAPISVQLNVDDEDGDYAYANLWIKTPNRGWLSVKADGSLVVSSQLSAQNSVATSTGTHTRTFTITPTDGAGVYTFALAAVDAQGQRTDAPVQTITAGDVNHTPTASFTLSSERKIEQTLSISVSVGDVDGDYAYANLWVRTPNRGWVAIKSDSSQVQTSSASAANTVAPLAGTVTRTFTFTATDGPGTYTIALAAFDANGARTDAPNQTITVEPSSAVVNVWSGGTYTLALRADGTLVGAGSNGAGNLTSAYSTSNYVLRYSPVATDVVSAAIAPASSSSTLYLKSDGSLYGVGSRGNGTIPTLSGDAGTPGLIANDVIAMAPGYEHLLLLNRDGELYSSGYNSAGQLGDGTTAYHYNPARIASGVLAIAAGRYHSLFLKADGSLWAVGYNTSGQLGDGTTTNRSTPIQVASNVVAISASDNNSYFIKTDGTLWGMGANGYYQLAQGSDTSYRSTPVQIATGVTKVFAGPSQCVFLKTNGSLWGIGYSSNGELGSSSYYYSSLTQIAPAARSASIYGSGMIARLDGTLSVAGSNYYGQLGLGDSNSRYSYTDALAGALPAPAAPTRLRGINGVAAPNVVTWVPVAAAASYEIWRNTSDDSTTAAKIGTTINSAFGDATAQVGTTYYYWVKSVNATGTSGFSASVSAGSTPNAAPTASFTLSSQRSIGQTITITSTVADADGNFAYADLWVKTPKRGWIAIKSNTETVATSALGAAHAFTISAGTFTRTFALTNTDGAGTYMFALAAVDANGVTTFAPSQYITVVGSNGAPTASFTLSSQRTIGQTLVISGTVGDPDGNLAYADLWVKTPNRGWMAIKSDGALQATDALGSAHATTTTAGSFSRNFALTNADGAGTYMVALAAVDSDGTVTFATNQYITVAATTNVAPTASFTVSSERTLGQTITINGTVGDADDNLVYANLWVMTPSRGWVAIKSDSTTTVTDALGLAHATTTGTGSFARTFTFNDGLGDYMFALAAVDATGAVTYATSQHVVVTAPPNTAPTASFTLSSERALGQTITISGTVGDVDNNFTYAGLWVKTPNRGWVAIKSDSTLIVTDALGAPYATTTTVGSFTRTFTFTNTDGTGTYIFALAARDSSGAVTFATNQYVAVTATANTAPTASFTLSSERALGQTITISGTVGDVDNNFTYANLWVKTPNRGWVAIKSDSTLTVTDALGTAHATTTTAGSFTRTFAFTNTDGTGTYMFALAAVDASGAVTFATSQYVTVTASANTAPTASFTVSSERTMGETITISGTVADTDGNLAYANLWVKTPNRGWVAIKSDNTLGVTDALGTGHATTTTAGSFTRTFTFTDTDGVGAYTVALAAVDAAGAVTFASNVYLTVGSAMHDAASESATSYTAWTQAHFTATELADLEISGPDVVYGDDGMTNLLKYALGLDPRQDGSAAWPQTTSVADHWFLTYRRPASVADVAYRVEASTDLINWTEAGVTQEMILSDGTTQTWQAQYQGSPGQTVYLRLNPVLR